LKHLFVKKITLLFYLFLISVNVFAQNKEVDSLQALLHTSIADTIKIKVLNELVNLNKGSDLEKALEFAKQSKAVSMKIKDESGKRNSLNNMGVIYTSLGNYNEALKCHFEAVQIGEKLKLKKEISASYQNIGNIYLNIADYPAALPYYLKSLKIKEELGNKKGMANTYNSLGNLYLAQTNYTLALENYALSSGLYKEVNDSNGLAVTYDGIASVYIGQKRYSDALQISKEALEIKKRLNNINGQYFCYNNLGNIYSQLDSFRLALKNYLSSLSIALEKGDPYDLATVYLSIGDVYTDLKDYVNATTFLNKGLLLSKEISSQERVRSGYKLLANMYAQKKDFKNAYDYSILFTGLNDSIFNEDKNKKIAEIQTKYETEKKEKEIGLLQQKNENLARNNEIKELQLNRSRFLVFTFAGAAVLILVIAFLIAGQTKLRTKQAQLIAEQKLLRSQMNPHFIFNSLNSIQDFIANYERDDALKYLSKFSKLIRSILKQSSNNNTTVADEIEMLKLYAELESLRFNHKFDCIFDVDDSINIYETEIPSMIIQPFLENTILHGFIGKENDCRILLSMKKAGEKLKCVIEDNGIGRKKAMEIKQNKSYQHPGLGIKLTSDRIDTINKTSKGKTSLHIEDLVDTKGNAIGTKVELEFTIT
jgi:tetratricopeptide (TPR) repeat protein